MTARSWGALIVAGGTAMMAMGEPAYAQQPVPPPRHVLEPPKLQGEATAPYPEGATGDTTVTLRLTVEADGSVSEAIADEGGEPFASAAIAAAKAWRFDPATRDGVPVRARIRVEIAFRPPEV